jgi:hypothetical protein
MRSVSRPTPRLARAAIAIAALAAPLACNVFASLDRCHADSDCASGSICDPEGHFCLRADASPPVEAGPDAPDVEVPDVVPPPCDPSKPFANIALVAGLENRSVFSARLTSDEKSVYLSVLNGEAGAESADIFVAGRASMEAAFGAPNILPNINTSASDDYWPTLSADGTLLFFESSRSLTKDGGEYTNDRARIWYAKKPPGLEGFGEPILQSLFATTENGTEGAPYLHPSGRSLYFISLDRPGRMDLDIFVATINSDGIAANITADIGDVNTADLSEHAPVVSRDDKVLFFAREDRATTIRDIYVATRSSPNEPRFGTAVPVDELNTSYEEFPTWVSDDLCRLYFASTRPADGDAAGAGTFRLWVASRPLK